MKRSFKYKLLSFDELVINLDRLSRFKLPEYSYKRVFSSIITKNLISPKYSLEDFEKMDDEYAADIVSEIWNNSVKNISSNINSAPYNALKTIIFNTFKNIDNRTKTFINSDLIISPVLDKIKSDNIPFNLNFLMKVNGNLSDKDITIENLSILREKYNLTFPVKKLLIVEGITEEILLPVFANKAGTNFEKKGIFILGAGGKSKSPALYQKIKNLLNIPIILLFDYDAKEIADSLVLNKKDKCILIQKGEFEDIIPANLIKRALNYEYEPASPLLISDLKIYDKMCSNIENFYKTRHLGEYKKSKVAKIIAEQVKYSSDISTDIKEILSFIS